MILRIDLYGGKGQVVVVSVVYLSVWGKIRTVNCLGVDCWINLSISLSLSLSVPIAPNIPRACNRCCVRALPRHQWDGHVPSDSGRMWSAASGHNLLRCAPRVCYWSCYTNDWSIVGGVRVSGKRDMLRKKKNNWLEREYLPGVVFICKGWLF